MNPALTALLSFLVLLSWSLPVAALPRVVFLGEQHTSEADHQFQLQALQTLTTTGQVVILAEMFTERSEDELRAWGSASGPTDFAPELWQREWGYPFELYSPIFGWAREAGVAVHWLRPDPQFTAQVRERGPAAAVSRLGEVLIGPASYRDFMAEIAGDHSPDGAASADQKMVDRMFTIQCFWDEFMAWRIASLAAEHPQHVLAVLVGDGHLREGEGIPWRLRRRAPELEIEVRRRLPGS